MERSTSQLSRVAGGTSTRPRVSACVWNRHAPPSYCAHVRHVAEVGTAPRRVGPGARRRRVGRGPRGDGRVRARPASGAVRGARARCDVYRLKRVCFIRAIWCQTSHRYICAHAHIYARFSLSVSHSYTADTTQGCTACVRKGGSLVEEVEAHVLLLLLRLGSGVRLDARPTTDASSVTHAQKAASSSAHEL